MRLAIRTPFATRTAIAIAIVSLTFTALPVAAQGDAAVRVIPVTSPGFHLRVAPDGASVATFVEPYLLEDREPDPAFLPIDIIDLESGRVTASLSGPTDYVVDVLFLPGTNELLALHSNGALAHWDLDDPGAPLKTVSTYGLGGELMYVPDGRVLVRSGGFSMSLWDIESGQILALVGKEFPSRAAYERSLLDRDYTYADADVSPDGRLVATLLFSGEVALRDLSTGELTLMRPSEEDVGGDVFFRDLRFSPDGESLAWYDSVEEVVALWGLPPSAGFTSVPADVGYAFSPDGQLIAWSVRGRGDEPDVVRVMSLEEGGPSWEVPLPLAPGPGQLTSVAFGPDPRTLFVGGFPADDGDNAIVVVTLEPVGSDG